MALAAAAEAGLRLARIGEPVWHRPDPMLGWALRPYAGSHGGGREAQVNAFGQRDREHALEKKPGVYRIAVLGDERSEALGVPLRATWWRELALELDRCGFAAGRKLEVLNFAVGGYSTAQEAIVLESEVMRYRPDLVLLQLSTGKDIRENSRTLATRVDRPFYFIDGEGRLRLDASFRQLRDFDTRSQFRYELARAASDHSRLLQALAKASPIDPAHAAIVAAPLPSGPSDTRWEDAWRVTEALLERMREFSVRNGARFAVLGAPPPAAPEAGYADARLAAFGASHAIRYVALAPGMRDGATEFYDADGRWTPAAHRAAARAAAAGLCRAFALGETVHERQAVVPAQAGTQHPSEKSGPPLSRGRRIEAFFSRAS